jgi:hypothetical protein
MLVLMIIFMSKSPSQTINPPNFVKKTRYINRLTRLNNQHLKDTPCTDKVCNRYCQPGVCNEYQAQLNKYNDCIKCGEENMCLSDVNNTCVKCPPNSQSCGQQFGCFDKYKNEYTAPFNPGANECKQC